MEEDGGYTWNRQQCYSRLDYIFTSVYLSSRIIKVKTDWAFEQSDHASVYEEIYINEEANAGPGLTKVNSNILENPSYLKLAISEINNLLAQIPVDWDPHKSLEYMKMAIRSVISDLVGKNRKETRKEIEELEEEINKMHELKI